ncbi:MAG: cytochrome c oxidase subunit 3 [Tepidisphaeraceae bacterium]
MSDTIIDHGYIPEEHAPDPVVGHGDPTPPGKVAIWLFLASEVMFFIGLLATYIIFRSGSPKIFAEHAAALSKPLAGNNTLVLIFSSLTMALAVDAAQKGSKNRTIICLAITVLCAFGFMGIKYKEYSDKFTHYTVVAREADGKVFVYDGHLAEKTSDALKLTHAHRMAMPADGPFNIHWMSAQGVKTVAAMQAKETGHDDDHATPTTAGAAAPNATHADATHADHGGDYTLPRSTISQAITYGPWKNIFYACYFATTGVHGLHVVGGIVALGLLLGHALRGKLLPAHTEYIGLYWHFVDLVWIFLFPLLYLI